MKLTTYELEYIAQAIAEVHMPRIWDRLTINGIVRNSYIEDARVAMIAAEEIGLMNVRNNRQKLIAEWCIAAFGKDHAASVEQRGLRLVEEVIEAAQAAQCDPGILHKLIDYIYKKPAGDLRQELGGVGICLLAIASAAGLNAEETENAECTRVLSKPLAFFTERNNKKNEAGFIAGKKQ